MLHSVKRSPITQAKNLCWLLAFIGFALALLTAVSTLFTGSIITWQWRVLFTSVSLSVTSLVALVPLGLIKRSNLWSSRLLAIACLVFLSLVFSLVQLLIWGQLTLDWESINFTFFLLALLCVWTICLIFACFLERLLSHLPNLIFRRASFINLTLMIIIASTICFWYGQQTRQVRHWQYLATHTRSFVTPPASQTVSMTWISVISDIHLDFFQLLDKLEHLLALLPDTRLLECHYYYRNALNLTQDPSSHRCIIVTLDPNLAADINAAQASLSASVDWSNSVTFPDDESIQRFFMAVPKYTSELYYQNNDAHDDILDLLQPEIVTRDDSGHFQLYWKQASASALSQRFDSLMEQTDTWNLGTTSLDVYWQ